MTSLVVGKGALGPIILYNCIWIQTHLNRGPPLLSNFQYAWKWLILQIRRLWLGVVFQPLIGRSVPIWAADNLTQLHCRFLVGSCASSEDELGEFLKCFSEKWHCPSLLFFLAFFDSLFLIELQLNVRLCNCKQGRHRPRHHGLTVRWWVQISQQAVRTVGVHKRSTCLHQGRGWKVKGHDDPWKTSQMKSSLSRNLKKSRT